MAGSVAGSVAMDEARLKSKWRLTNPWTQNFMSGICLFLTAGIYHAITGLGAGGGKPESLYVATTTNAVLYVIFTTVGFFGGSVLNTFGPRITYVIGCFGYPFYTTGLWYFDAQGQSWYPFLGGAVLGFTAGLLWTAANFIQFAYAPESDKGAYVAWQLFSLAIGSAVGAVIPFGINFNAKTANGVPTSVYIAFVVLMMLSMVVAWFGIKRPEDIVREDGTHIAVFQAVKFKDEFIHCLELLKDWRILVLILPMFATEISLGLIPTLNARSCNLRTRSLNNLLYWTIGIPTAVCFRFALDTKMLKRRRSRGLLGLGINFAITTVGWVLVFVFQQKHNLRRAALATPMDWTDEDYGLICAIMLIFGIIFYINQMFVMWIMGALSNDPRIAGRYGGFYKAMLSAGLCVAFGLEAAKVEYLHQTIIHTVLMFAGFVLLFVIITRAIKDTNYLTEASVIPPKSVEADLKLHGKEPPTYEIVETGKVVKHET